MSRKLPAEVTKACDLLPGMLERQDIWYEIGFPIEWNIAEHEYSDGLGGPAVLSGDVMRVCRHYEDFRNCEVVLEVSIMQTVMGFVSWASNGSQDRLEPHQIAPEQMLNAVAIHQALTAAAARLDEAIQAGRRASAALTASTPEPAEPSGPEASPPPS